MNKTARSQGTKGAFPLLQLLGRRRRSSLLAHANLGLGFLDCLAVCLAEFRLAQGNYELLQRAGGLGEDLVPLLPYDVQPAQRSSASTLFNMSQQILTQAND